MRQAFEDVWTFHVACGLPVSDLPAWPDAQRLEFRGELFNEEYRELTRAIYRRDLVEAADAIGDCIYVLTGTAIELGIPLDRVWDEIQYSNMKKVDPVTGLVRKRADGKIIKPDGWQPPRIAEVIELAKMRQRRRTLNVAA